MSLDVVLKELRDGRKAAERLEKVLFESLDTTGLQFDALVQQSEGWTRARRGKLTASRFGVICELSKYATARSYWELLTGRLPSEASTQSQSADTRRGVQNEHVALELYSQTLGTRVEAAGLFVLPAPLDFLGASPDALTLDGCGIVEIKCPARGHASTISEEYMAQIQGQLSICKRQYCDFVSFHVDSQSLIVRRVLRSDAYWNWMLPLLKDFSECLRKDVPPPFRSERAIAGPPPVSISSLYG